MSAFMGSKIINDKSLFSYKWYESLHIKVAAFFILFFTFAALSAFMVLKEYGDAILEEEAYLRLNQANSKVISELERHIILSATLVQALANAAEGLPNDQYLYRTLLPKLLNHKGAESYIAGGGVWPGPYQFNPNEERHSFFWARNRFKGFIFHDSYNKQDDSYHTEEWYVPATHLADDAVYWSKSYIDPYSLEPMVTVSAPLIKNQKNVGVATIDLKLQGLHQLLENVTRSFDGYAFALDRNGTFLSYPNQQDVISNQIDNDLNETASFITYQEFTKKNPKFSPFAKLLDKQNSSAFKTSLQKNKLIKKLAFQLTAESDKITEQEAQLIASRILYPTTYRYNTAPTATNILMDKDPLLNEPAFVATTVMPETHWEIITVMPYRIEANKISQAYKHLMQAMLIALLLTVLSIWLFIKYTVTSPISRLVKQIQFELDNSNASMDLCEISSKGELRALINAFNLRSKQLLHSQQDYDKLTHFDPLTTLSNRQSLVDKLKKEFTSSESTQGYGALLFINLDNFKRINDSLGHQVGDELLTLLAARFTQCVGSNDTVARLGGDEFVVLIMKNYTYARKLTHESTSVAQKIIDAMQQPILLKGQPHHMTLSIGITIFSNQGGHSDKILRQADSAMHHAKEKGKNCFCLFNNEMEEDASRRLEIEEALRLAIKQKELFLVYQPQVDKHGNCISVEVLVRWTDPSKGILSPAEFINIAEEYGLILDLGYWILEEACSQFNDWADNHVAIDNISINVSPEQFRDINFVSSVRKTINKHQLEAGQLTLEITEGIVIADIKDTIYKMKQLKAIGVQLAIDDFGVGDSALRYLKDLPLNQLKIEPSFTQDIINQPDDAMILKAIIDMARHLQFDLIAKGVEDEQQLARLIELGCERFQGFYFSAPKTAAEISQYLRDQKR